MLPLALVANRFRQPCRHNVRILFPCFEDFRHGIVRRLAVLPQGHGTVDVPVPCAVVNRLKRVAVRRLCHPVQLDMQHPAQIVLAGNLRLVLIHLDAARAVFHNIGDRMSIWEVRIAALCLLPDRQIDACRKRPLVFHIHLIEIQRDTFKAFLVFIGDDPVFIHLERIAQLINGQRAKVGEIQGHNLFSVALCQIDIQHAGLKIRTDPFGIHIPSKGGPSQQRQHKQKRDNR